MFSVKGGNRCMMHGGNKQLEAKSNASLRNYQLTQFRAKLERHSTSDNIKGLRDEIGILRMTLETRLNQCNDEMDLLLHSGPISDLVLKIDRLVNSCHKLEGSMGQLLDKTAIIQFANVVIEIIGSEVEDQVVVSRIAEKIIEGMQTEEAA